MKERISALINRASRPNQRARFVAWMKEYISEMDRPIDYLIEGSVLQRGIITITLGVGLIVGPWIVTGWFTNIPGNRISLYSAGTSILLTAGLLWIYLSMAESARKQTKLTDEQTDVQNQLQSLQEMQVGLQEDQVEIMGAEFEPVIEVLDFGVGDKKPPTGHLSLRDNRPHRGDFFRIEISNLTDAIATNLRLRFLVDYIGPQGLVSGADVPLTQVGNDQSWTSKPGGIIQGQQTEIEYHCIVGMKSPPMAREHILPFEACMSYLFDRGDVSRIRIGLLLVYEDRKGTEHEIELEGLDLSESDRPDTVPTLARIRNAASDVPAPVIEKKYLSEGIAEIPPQYTR